MAKKDYYTVYDRGDHFLCQKMDPDDATPMTHTDGNASVMTAYKIMKAGPKMSTCECWAGSKWCRHKQMVVLFQQEGRINKGWLYNFDKKKWIPPIDQTQEA